MSIKTIGGVFGRNPSFNEVDAVTIKVNGVDVSSAVSDIAGLAVTDGNVIVGDGTNWVAESGATARTSLGLGSIATQASDNVDIDGGAIDGVTLGGNSQVTVTDADINGGSIDGVVIGGSSATTGNFTTINSERNVNNLNITSTITSAFVAACGTINRTAANGTYLSFQRAGSEIGNINTTNATSVNYNTSSDYRLKENVVSMTGAIDRVKALKPLRFNFIVNPDMTVDGFLAHEAQEIVPEAVTGEKDQVEAIGNVTDAEGVVVKEGVTEPIEFTEGQTWTKTGERPVMQGIDQAKLVPLLTGALKEAIARIEALESEVETLKGN